MILQRMSQAIKRQDWFQVNVEILIVVIGIFLGLQVQAWFQEQQNIELEQVYLNRLITDMEVNEQVFSRSKIGAIRKQDWLEKIETSIQTSDISPATNTEFFDGLSHSQRNSGSTAQAFRETYEELQNTGRLILIRNTDLRYEIAEFYRREAVQALRLASMMTGYDELMFEIVDPRLNIVRRYNVAAYAQEVNNLPAQEQDQIINSFLLAANEEKFMRQLNAELNYTRFLIDRYDRLATLATELKAKLEQQLTME